jgi:CheY-like chemotaxis protein
VALLMIFLYFGPKHLWFSHLLGRYFYAFLTGTILYWFMRPDAHIGSVWEGRKGNDMQQAKAKILLVEDEERLQRVLARTLEQSNYQVSTASTAAAAVLSVLAGRPDVLVLDINLPDDTGWGVLRQLAARGITCEHLPTIMLSAGQPAQRRIAEFQPYAFLPKPFPVDALKRLIAEVLVDKTTQDANDGWPPGRDRRGA